MSSQDASGCIYKKISVDRIESSQAADISRVQMRVLILGFYEFFDPYILADHS